jgi:hypothetical protein
MYVSVEKLDAYDDTFKNKAPPAFPVLIVLNDEFFTVSDCTSPFNEYAPFVVASILIPSKITESNTNTPPLLLLIEMTPLLFTASDEFEFVKLTNTNEIRHP